MNVVLISTYELGHQPFGLAEPAACLRARGDSVRTLDLTVESWDEDLVREADLAAFYVPMHTATRLAARLIPRVKHLNSRAHIAAYGLYAPTNEAYLRELGVGTVLGGEFEAGLKALADRLQSGVSCKTGEQLEQRISVAGQRFLVPDRSDLPALERYAFLRMADGETRVTGYVEASRGLQASLPALPGGAGVQRTLSCRAARHRAGRPSPASDGGRTPYYLRRSGFLQRADPRCADRRGRCMNNSRS